MLFAAAATLALAGCGDDPPAPQPDERAAVTDHLADQVEQNQSELDNLEKQLAAEEQGARAEEERKDARPRDAAPPRDGTLLTAADKASFGKLVSRLGGRSGVAVAPLGVGQRVEEAGSVRSGVAWSTIKVPLVAAAFSAAPDGTTRGLARRAITASDNAAAEQLWSRLGGGTRAGRAVQRQLAAAGDATTRVQTQRVRAGFTPFGQTVWPLRAQVRFMAGFPCVSNATEILTLMGSVIASQRWGLGSVGRKAQLKGGWGPDASGAYMVRQVGVLELGAHPVAVGIITQPADGSFATGTRNVSEIARWVEQHVARRPLPSRPRC
ncbi:MAG TPA: hypothetical protein VF549_10840 [Solirubrobacteraceae bacterium]